jgi:hypothetical protein
VKAVILRCSGALGENSLVHVWLWVLGCARSLNHGLIWKSPLCKHIYIITLCVKAHPGEQGGAFGLGVSVCLVQEIMGMKYSHRINGHEVLTQEEWA